MTTLIILVSNLFISGFYIIFENRISIYYRIFIAKRLAKKLNLSEHLYSISFEKLVLIYTLPQSNNELKYKLIIKRNRKTLKCFVKLTINNLIWMDFEYPTNHFNDIQNQQSIEEKFPKEYKKLIVW